MKAFRRVGQCVTAAVVATGVLAGGMAPAVEAEPGSPTQSLEPVLGDGSSYVAPIMQQWTRDVNVRNIPVQYRSSSSPNGLRFYQGLTVDFAGTEAEFSSMGIQDQISRGYQYIPDVAGAVAIMYNVQDQAGRRVDYLHLSRSTVAKIFMGEITHWNDPAVSNDNRGLVLPGEPIQVVYRAGDSGTTALFYDFVANTEPGIFQSWGSRLGLNTAARILNPAGGRDPNFAPKIFGAPDSAEAARYVATTAWTIGYDEFAYPKQAGADVAWIDNASGNWVLPYAPNISAALDGATLRPDLSQELSGVYSNPDPRTYPISAYSYIVTQCAPSADRNTCVEPYREGGVTETMTKFLEHIACQGQTHAARDGYSPLPMHLSQEIYYSIARMRGEPRDSVPTLTAENCVNPRFHGGFGEGSASPPDPLADVECIGSSCDEAGRGGGSSSSTGTTGEGDVAGAAGTTGDDAGDDEVAGPEGGSRDTRRPEPVGYRGIGPLSLGTLALLTLLLLLATPPLVGVLWPLLRRRRPEPPD